jgi:hypothetical protein
MSEWHLNWWFRQAYFLIYMTEGRDFSNTLAASDVDGDNFK